MISPTERATVDVVAWQDHGDHAARARAIQSVEPLIWKMARQHHRRVGRFGVDLDDLVSAGREGATIATNRFDRDRGASFSTAAWQSIRDRIGATARHGSGVASLGKGDRVRSAEITINRAAAQAESEGMSPNRAMHHAAAVAGISPADAVALARRAHAVTWEADKHDLGGADGGAEIVAHAASVAAVIEDCLGDLTPREADIVRSRFLVVEQQTLGELGQRHGVSKQQICRLKKDALARLGSALRRRGLRAKDLL